MALQAIQLYFPSEVVNALSASYMKSEKDFSINPKGFQNH